MPAKRILLVADEPEVRDLLAHVLYDAGYVVDAASTIAQAYRFLDGQSDALVIADWRPPMVMGRSSPSRRRTSGPRPT